MRTKLTIRLMKEFATRTGLLESDGEIQQRYLWTDAFAVSTFFRLAHITGENQYRQLALRLIDQVHHTLGRFAAQDSRTGWISGLSEEKGEDHPTAGGLRIGKPMLERNPNEPFNERLEWERDGQYFHYLAQWIYSLFRAYDEEKEIKFAQWAAELTQVAIQHFVVRDQWSLKMYWKMSVDLSRPLVPSMGAHDPLEGYICAKMSAVYVAEVQRNITTALLNMTELCHGRNWTTNDPLGIGGLLLDAARIAKLPKDIEWPPEIQLNTLLRDIQTSLEIYSASQHFEYPVEHRLAFRECGLSLGLRQIKYIQQHTTDEKCLTILEQLEAFLPLADRIEAFWCIPENQQSSTWNEHCDINAVTLASSLIADTEHAI